MSRFAFLRAERDGLFERFVDQLFVFTIHKPGCRACMSDKTAGMAAVVVAIAWLCRYFRLSANKLAALVF